MLIEINLLQIAEYPLKDKICLKDYTQILIN